MTLYGVRSGIQRRQTSEDLTTPGTRGGIPLSLLCSTLPWTVFFLLVRQMCKMPSSLPLVKLSDFIWDLFKGFILPWPVWVRSEECQPRQWRVSVLIPGQGTYQGCRLIPVSCGRQPINRKNIIRWELTKIIVIKVLSFLFLSRHCSFW